MSEPHGPVRARGAIAALILGALLLPASALAQDASPAGSAPPQPAASGELHHLSVGLGYIPSVQFAPFYLAQTSGAYSAAGLDVVMSHHDDPDLVALVAQGGLDLGLGDGTSIIVARSQGIPVRFVSAIYARFPVVVVAPVASGIERPGDLDGRRLGTPGPFGSSWIMLQALLSSAGLVPDDLDIRFYRDYGQATGLAQGQVDAITGFLNNEPIALERQGIKVRTLAVDDIVPLPGPGLMTSDATLAARHDDLAAFVRVTLDAMEAISADPQRGLDATFQVVPDLATDPELQLAILQATIDAWHSDLTEAQGLGAIDPADWTASIDFMTAMPGSPLGPSPVTADQIVTTELLPSP